MAERYVRMRFMTSGEDKAKATLDELAEKARRLGMMRPEVKPDVNDTAAQAKIKDLRLKFDILSRKQANMRADVQDDKAKAKILSLSASMDRLGRKIADPKVNLRDADLVEAQLLRIKGTLDDIHNKDVRIKFRESGFARAKMEERSLSKGGGIFSRLLHGRNGGVSGNTGPLQGLFSGGPGQALAGMGPEAIAAIGGLAAVLLPVLTGATVGAGGAALTGGLSIAAAQRLQKQLPILAKAIPADEKALANAENAKQRRALQMKLSDDRSQLSLDTRLFPTFRKTSQGLGNLMTTMENTVTKALAPVQMPIQKVLQMLANNFQALGPVMAKFFKASMPFMRVFADMLLRMSKALLPAFIQVMNQMVKSGALKIFAQGMVELVKGLGALMVNMGPAFRVSALAFLGIMKLLGITLNGLGRLIGFVVAHWKILMVVFLPFIGAAIEIVTHLSTMAHWFDITRHAVAAFADVMLVGFDKLRHILAAFGDAVLHVFSNIGHVLLNVVGWINHAFDNIRHTVASVLDNLGLAKWGHFVASVFDHVRHDVAAAWDKTWSKVSSVFASWVSDIKGMMMDYAHSAAHVFDNLKTWVTHIWADMWKKVTSKFGEHFSIIHNMLKDFTSVITHTFTDIKHFVSETWDHMWRWVHDRFMDFAGSNSNEMKRFRGLVGNIFGGIKHDVTTTWDRMWHFVHDRASSALDALKGTINRLVNIFRVPIKWVIEHAVDPLVRAWDAIAPHVGLPKFAVPGFAAGGRVTQGTTSQADDVLVRVSKDETIVSASHSRQLADQFAALGVPGYASGGRPGGVKHGSPGAEKARGNRGGVGHGGSIGSLFKHIAHDMFGLIPGGILQSLAGLFPGGIGAEILGAIAKGGKRLIGTAAKDLLDSHLSNNGVPGLARHTGDTLIEKMMGELASGISNSSGSGSAVAKWFIKTFKHTPYVWGGGSLHGTDCSGSTAMAYEKFGFFKDHFPSRGTGPRSTSESQFGDFGDLKRGGAGQAGSLIFFAGSDGSASNPGHVGITLDANRYASMYDTAEDFAIKPIRGSSGALSGYRMPKRGFPRTGGPVGPGLVGIGRALMSEGFRRAAAAGICGTIAIESGGHPDSIEGDEMHRGRVPGAGRWGPNGGLIGWTGTWTGPGEMITGNIARDLSAQVTGIKRYVQRNGSMGDMNRFRDPVGASIHFSEQYERPLHALSDVDRAAARSVYSRLDNGWGWLKPGVNMVYNGLGRMERISDPERFGSGGGGDVFNIHVSGTLDDNAAATKVVQALTKLKRNKGGAKLGLD